MSGFDYDNYISPCKNICRLDLDGHYCIGCYRTVEEKKNWFKYSKDEKLQIMETCKLREKEGFPKDFFK